MRHCGVCLRVIECRKFSSTEHIDTLWMGIRVLEESAGNIFCKEDMLISTHQDTCRYI
jgi:hypothetical protein